MAKGFDVLKEQANVIKNEVEDGANTASRVGGMFEDIVDRIEEFQKLGYIFSGVATPTTNPGIPDGNVFYIAKNPGVYPNFSSIEVYFSEIGILYWNTSSWKKHSISLSKLIEDVNISNIYPTGGTDGTDKYTLETAIAKVGAELRHAGLKVTFLNAEGKTETWEFQGGAFTLNSFIKVGALELNRVYSEVGIFNYKGTLEANKGMTFSYFTNCKGIELSNVSTSSSLTRISLEVIPNDGSETEYTSIPFEENAKVIFDKESRVRLYIANNIETGGDISFTVKSI